MYEIDEYTVVIGATTSSCNSSGRLQFVMYIVLMQLQFVMYIVLMQLQFATS
jgi:hypothetical protein